MASGDTQSLPQHMTYSKSRVPIVGSLIDYIDTSLEYLRRKTFARAENLHAKASRATLSATFMAAVCLIMGLTCNVKIEVVKFDEEPLPNDLHFMLMSKDDKLYIDDIDVSRIMWCLEASDTLVVLISCLLIWNSPNVVQLLPSVVGKRILSFLPRTQLGDYTRVNKYWAYLVDEFRAELAARQKINNDLDKLQEQMLRHDTSMDILAQIDFQNIAPSSQGIMSAAPSNRMKPFQPSVRASEKSAGAVSFRHMLDGKLTKPTVALKPIRKLSELTDRLNNAVPLTKTFGYGARISINMSKEWNRKSSKPRREISNATMLNVPRHPGVKRYSLWTRDFSKLYPVVKIPSHQSPV